jgi:GNAT superfamily N-acetyltransferase
VPVLPPLEVAAGRRFAEIGLTSIAADEPPTEAALHAHVDDGTAWVAEVDGTVVGYAIASVVDGEGHLDQVSVLDEQAGQGLGRALIEAVEGWARHQGFEAVTLTTFTEVAWNGPLYAHLGYEVLSEDELGPELAAIRAQERADGLDVSPRRAMRRRLDPM